MNTAVINKFSFKILAAVVLILICSIAMAAPETVLSAVEQGLASGQFSKDDLSLLTQIQNTKSINTVIYCGMTLSVCFLAGVFLSEKTGVIGAIVLTLIVFGAGCVGFTALEEAEANARMTPQLILAQQAIQADAARKKEAGTPQLQSDRQQELSKAHRSESANTETVETENKKETGLQGQTLESQSVSSDETGNWRGFLFLGLILAVVIAMVGLLAKSLYWSIIPSLWAYIAGYNMACGSIVAVQWTIAIGVGILVLRPIALFVLFVVRQVQDKAEEQNAKQRQLENEIQKTRSEADELRNELKLLKADKESIEEQNESLHKQSQAVIAQFSAQAEQVEKYKLKLEETIRVQRDKEREQNKRTYVEQNKSDSQQAKLLKSLENLLELKDALEQEKKDLERKIRLQQSKVNQAQRDQRYSLRYQRQLANDNATLRLQIKTLNAEIEKLKKFMSKEGRDELHWQVINLEAKLVNSEKEKATLKDENKKLFQKYTALQTKMEVGRQLGEARKTMSVKAAPSLESVLSALGGVPSENRKKEWETTAGRIKIDGKYFYSYDNPRLTGAGALQLVRKTMNASFIRAVMILKAGLGMGPALGAMEEFLELYKDKLPDIAKPVLLEREPVSSEE